MEGEEDTAREVFDFCEAHKYRTEESGIELWATDSVKVVYSGSGETVSTYGTFDTTSNGWLFQDASHTDYFYVYPDSVSCGSWD